MRALEAIQPPTTERNRREGNRWRAVKVRMHTANTAASRSVRSLRSLEKSGEVVNVHRARRRLPDPDEVIDVLH